MLFSCLFLVLLSSACFSQANAYRENFASRQALDENADDVRLRGQMDDYGNQREEAAESDLEVRAKNMKADELVGGSLGSVENMMNTLLKGVKNAKAGNNKRAEKLSAELKRQLEEAQKYASLLEKYHKS